MKAVHILCDQPAHHMSILQRGQCVVCRVGYGITYGFVPEVRPQPVALPIERHKDRQPPSPRGEMHPNVLTHLKANPFAVSSTSSWYYMVYSIE